MAVPLPPITGGHAGPAGPSYAAGGGVSVGGLAVAPKGPNWWQTLLVAGAIAYAVKRWL